jgi:tRNA threonylcarbamoyladenosine biosynthesis protein TsaB
MLILGVDTSWKQGSIALVREKAGGGSETIEIQPIAGGTFSAQLIPQLARMLSDHGLSKQDIGGFAAASGPGSFTGLRIGLTAVKALAEILHRPIAAVSVLEALAVEAGRGGAITVLLDAARSEVFLGIYEVAKGSAVKREELLLTQAELVASIERHQTAFVVTPDAKISELFRKHSIPVKLMERPGSESIARIGMKKIARGEVVTVDELDANYIRRSDAEIFSLPKLR